MVNYMMMYLAMISLSFVILHIAWQYYKKIRYYNQIPGIPGLPILGNMLQLNLSNEGLWLFFRETAKTFNICKLTFLTNVLVVIRHPDDLKVILSSKENVNKSNVYNNLRFFAGEGLVISKKDLWKHRRKLVSPAFSAPMIRMNSVIVGKHIQSLIMSLKSQGDETVQSLVSLFKKLAIGIICETGMGVNVNKSEIEGGEAFIHALDHVLKTVAYRSIRPYIQDWMMNFLPIGREQNRCIKSASDFRNKIIAERRKYLDRIGFLSQQSWDNIKIDDSNDDESLGKSLLDILLLAEKSGLIDHQGVCNEVTVFIATGYDTVGLTICYALMLFAENKEIQDLARKEIFEVCKQSNGNITIAETQQLEYLDRCVKEILRLFPIAPHVGRYTSEGLQFRDYYIPAGSEVILDIYDLHRDPELWPNPQKFDPDRFLPENAQGRHPFAYLPFSGGVRNCIGFKYATMSIKIILSHLLYNFYFEPVDKISEITFLLDVVLNPKHPPRTKFIKINHPMK